jgi:hypothetical protein
MSAEFYADRQGRKPHRSTAPRLPEPSGNGYRGTMPDELPLTEPIPRDDVRKVFTESLILAQDERWRRA